MQEWEKAVQLFDSGDYTACIGTLLGESFMNNRQHIEVLEMLFHCYVELDRLNDAHTTALQLLNFLPTNTEVASSLVLDSIVNLECKLLQKVASSIENEIICNTLIDAAKSQIVTTFPMPYSLVLCLLRSLQGRTNECMRAVRAMKDREDYVQAYEIAKNVLLETPNSFPFYWIGLVCSHHAGTQEEYVCLLSRATELYPHCWRLHFYYALHLYQEQRFDRALDAYRYAIELNPHSWEIWTRYGDCLAKSGRWGEALKAYKKALELYRVIQTPVRYSAILYLAGRFVRLQSSRYRLPRFLPTLWYSFISFPTLVREGRATWSFVGVVETMCEVQIQLKWWRRVEVINQGSKRLFKNHPLQ